MDDYLMDALVMAYWSTVLQLVREHRIDDAVKVANQFVKISETLSDQPTKGEEC